MQLFILTNLNKPMWLAASLLAADLDIQHNRHHVNTVKTYLEIKHISGKKWEIFEGSLAFLAKLSEKIK